MKTFIICFTTLFFNAVGVKGQRPNGSSKKLDSVSHKVIAFFQGRQPDSVYALTGKAFGEKITQENSNAITTTKIFPTTDFQKIR